VEVNGSGIIPASKEDCKTFCPMSRTRPVTPGRHPNDKYPVNISHRSRFVSKCFTRSIIW